MGIPARHRLLGGASPFFLLLFLLAAFPRASAQGFDPGEKEWNQALASPGRTSCVDVIPVRNPPRIEWRMKLPGKLLAGPVTWSGALYVVAGTPSSPVLLTLDIETGEEIAKTKLTRGKKGDPLSLCVWQGTVAVLEHKQIQGFHLKDGRLSRAFRKKGIWEGSLLTHAGRLIAVGKGRVHILDAQTGRVLADAPAGAGMPALRPLQSKGAFELVTAEIGEREDHAGLHCFLVRHLLTDLETSKPKLALDVRLRVGLVYEPLPGSDSLWALIRMGGAWLVYPPADLRTTSGRRPACLLPDGANWPTSSSEFRAKPAVWKGKAFGFEGTTLSWMNPKGEIFDWFERKHQPLSAAPIRPSLAKDVLFLGNWAVDVRTGKMIWSRDDLPPPIASLPIGDGLLLVVTTGNELVTLADPKVRPKTTPASGESAAPPSFPGSEDGVLLQDGRWKPGQAESVEGGGVRIVPEGGEPLEIPLADVAFAAGADGEVIAGDELAVHAIWNAALDGAFHEEIIDLARQAIGKGLLTDARRLAEEARTHGLSEEEYRALVAELRGRRESTAKGPKRVLAKAESAWREKHRDDLLAAVEWCRKRGLGGAATLLLQKARAAGVPGATVLARAGALVPMGFPGRDGPDADLRWLESAEFVVLCRARFLLPEDSAWDRVKPEWKETGIALRTPSLLIFSKDTDLARIGPGLLRMEGTVQALDAFLAAAPPRPVLGDDDRLEIHIHADPKSVDALCAHRGSGSRGGFYRPEWRATHLNFTPGISLTETMWRDALSIAAREVARQYFAERVLGRNARRSVATPGHWVWAGFETFIQDQAPVAARGPSRLDALPVPALDAAVQMMNAKALWKSAELLTLTRSGILKLGPTPTVPIEVRKTGRGTILGPLLLFPEQSAALFYFLANRAGPERRAALIRYLLDHARGRPPANAPRALGYDSAKPLDRDFRKFLAGL